MSNKNKKNNISNCSHKGSAIEKNLIPKNNPYDFCPHCGSISILDNNRYYYTIKPNEKNKKSEVDPVKIVNEMKNSEKENYFLDNLYNISDKDMKYQVIQKRITLYLSKRKLLLFYLQNITKALNYSDLSFYHTLLLTDLYLSYNINENMSDEKLLYLLIGFFLIASKFKENDIFEPEAYIFCDFDWDYDLTPDRILYYEAKCLKAIQYDFFIYSTYDWLHIFMGIGYVFDGEIDSYEEIKEINSYTFKLLIAITPIGLFIKYAPLHNAISIIQICREDKIDKNKINVELFNKMLSLYNLKFSDYENCYNDIKIATSLSEKNKNKDKDKDKDKENSNDNNTKEKPHNMNKKENKTLDDLNYDNNKNKYVRNKELKSVENDKTGKDLKITFKRKLNIQQKLRDNKFLSQLFSSANTSKGKSKINSIDNKSKGLNVKNKTLQLLEYQRILPRIKKINNESEKVLQTDIGGITGRKNEMFSINKNGLFVRLIDEKNKNKSGTLDSKIFSHDGKNPFFFNRFLRNVTYDTLKYNDKKLTRKFNKSNFILDYNYDNYKKLLNKSSDGLKYNISSNPKNINEIYNLNQKSKSNKNNIIKINSNYNLYKKNKNSFLNDNNDKKNYNKQSSSFNLESNNIQVIKPENSLIEKDNKNENTIGVQTEQNIIKDKHEGQNSSLEKNKNKNKINLFNIRAKKIDFSNMKFNKTNMNEINDLLKLKKLIFDGRKLPKLKLKFDK